MKRFVKYSVLSLYAGYTEAWKIPFRTHPSIRRGVEELAAAFARHGITMFRAPIRAFDGKVFMRAWKWDGAEWQVVRAVCPSLVWNKLPYRIVSQHIDELLQMERCFLTMNAVPVITTAAEKYVTRMLFPTLTPRTWYVVRREDLLRLVRGPLPRKVVVKPAVGSSGKWVRILPSAKLQNIRVTEPLLVQEFIDSSRGIPGLVHGPHDLRVGILGHRIAYSYLRIPKKGSLIANIAKGGRAKFVRVEDIPKSVIRAVRTVTSTLQLQQPSFYTIDFIVGANGRPKILELNHTPGVSFTGLSQEERQHIQERIARYFSTLVS